MAYIDTFIFNDEFDLLDLRLELLAPVVDHFVLVEASRTFSGLAKPVHFAGEVYWQQMKHRIDQWRGTDNGIQVAGFTHIIVDDMPDTDNPWEREAWQRNAILRGLMEIRPDDDDIVLISDVDEFPDPRHLRNLKDSLPHWLREHGTSAVFEQALYMYSLQWRHKRPWYGTRAIRWGDLQYPNDLRSTLCPLPDELVIKDGGWSFSSFGGVEDVQRKVAAFSHQEVNRPEYINAAHVEACIREGRGLMPGQDDWCERVNSQDSLPEPLSDRSRWPAVWFGEDA